ncbi:MAG: beta strand repeat-containing protein [Candidatus Tyrphobacter sp.]
MCTHLRVVACSLALSLCALALDGCTTSIAALSQPPSTGSGGVAQTYTVTTLDDAGTGSLRAALASANALPPSESADIRFAVSGTITLASDFPAVSRKVTIDATTAPNYAKNGPVIEIDANGHAGLTFASGSNGSQLLGVALGAAAGNGLTLDASHIIINLDYIGLTATGAPLGNTGDGVFVAASASQDEIGLNAAAASGVLANVIAANLGNGITLSGSESAAIVANRIGTNPAGTSAMPNGGDGILITGNASENEIGGTDYIDSTSGRANDPTGDKGTVAPTFVVPPLGNLISGNAGDGVLIDDGSHNNTLNGNFIGTASGGDAPLGNAGDGVLIDGANDNALVGCTISENPFVYYNVVSANGANGLHVTNSNGITVQGNFFGTGADNTTLLGNAGDGILVDGTSQQTTVGGVIPLGNVSSGNLRNGIEVAGSVSGFTTFNTFGGLLAFKSAAPNRGNGLLITATGGSQTVRTNVFSGNLGNGIEIGGNASGVNVVPDIIGLNTTGIALLPNGGDGILIDGTAHGNVVGGSVPSVIPQNTISGNAGYGIAIAGQAYGNHVFASFIGTNVLGTIGLGNGLGGVYAGGSTTNDLIGTTSSSPENRNLISANTGNGVSLDAGTSDISVIDNRIGVDRTETKALPNAGVPIFVNAGSLSDTISGNITSPV